MPQYLLPSYLILGGVKCGTSSLYRYLNAHPEVLPCKSKEPNFFSFRPWYKVALRWSKYKQMFPRIDQKDEFVADWLDLGGDEKMHASQFSKSISPDKTYITGEATATSFFAANPRVVKYFLPQVKLIMLMRDPVDRYVSHYRMYERFKREGRKGYDFEPLEQYAQKEIEQHRMGKKTRILHQGLYGKYLKKWIEVFGRDALLILRTQDFEQIESGQLQMQEACNFLGLTPFDFRDALSVHYNQAKKIEIPLEVSHLLTNFYADSKRKLFAEFGINL